MSTTPPSSSLPGLQTRPGLSVLRLAALAAGPAGELDEETLGLMGEQVAEGVLAGLAPREAWPELARGLMAEAPSRMLRTLAGCGALAALLPEVAALFGVPQSADDPPEVDIGEHLLRVVDEAARVGAPLALRFAALVMNVGKADSPREHLPAHYRHLERGRPRIEAIAARLGVAEDCLDLALLALAEVERVHRAAQRRAGSIAALLERVGAFDRPARFARLMTLCTCDFRAYPGRASRPYPKAAMLAVALQACAGIDEAAVGARAQDPQASASALLQARAEAIAMALRSERWAATDLAG
jgi:tRNA nucleotidyltransferase (CCA-adding enzyme)